MKDNQMINIDLAGQNVSRTTQERIIQKIIKKSGGVIKYENIEFIK